MTSVGKSDSSACNKSVPNVPLIMGLIMLRHINIDLSLSTQAVWVIGQSAGHDSALQNSVNFAICSGSLNTFGDLS